MASKRTCAKRTKMQVKRLKNDKETVPTLSTKLTDVNNDCLELVFEYLDVHDLINVAESSKCLRTAAIIVFGRNHKAKTLDITFDDFGLKRTYWPMLYRQIHAKGSSIKAVMPGPVLKLLRIFGCLIQRINMVAGCRSRCAQVHKRIYGYINKYCSNTLKTITLWHEMEIGAAGKKKPLKGVEEVNLTMSELELIDYRKFFPNVRRFCLTYAKFADRKRFVAKYSRLEDFEIDYCYEGKLLLGKNDVKQIIRLNPGLRGFGLTLDCEPYIWQTLSKWSPQVETLKIMYKFRDILQYKGKPIRFENVENLLMRTNIDDELYEQNPEQEIILEFVKLRDCQIVGRFKEFWMKFITQNPTIEKMHIEHGDNDRFVLTNEDITKITKTLTNLTDFSIRNCDCALDDIIKLLYGCNSIYRFSWTLESEMNRNRENIEVNLTQLSSIVADDWHSTMEDGNSIVLERKR